MAILKWDKVGERIYETGLDKGVLYLPNGSAVPWNGLTSVIEKFDKESSPVYYDGMKINELVVLGSFSATMKAITYPDEFLEVSGLGQVKSGIFFADQMPNFFGLCYRTQVGNDVEGEISGHKIHILYNLVAIPNQLTYETTSNDPKLLEFEWEIIAVPEEIPGFHPTAHIIIDTRTVDSTLMKELEDLLYGTSGADATLISMSDLVAMLTEVFRIRIIDNGDGTWTAVAERDGYIFTDLTGWFQIINVNAVYLDDVTYLISSTEDVIQTPNIRINAYSDGTWTASTDQDEVIVVVGDGVVEIRNANTVVVNSNTYRISDS